MNQIKTVEPGSIAEELEIEVGDQLISINQQPVVDIIDYMFLSNDEFVEIEIEKSNGEIWTLDIEKEYDEPIGITFENPIIDDAKRCTNNCVFCFIDQLPKGMRPSLYFKDDDSRLSFLQGNFVTLTNLKEPDIERIIRYRISPINVSVHTTDPELRKKMLGNRFAGNIMERLKKLVDGGIVVNAQIVLCPGYNDGDALDKTLTDLMTLHPNLNSVAIVPIGLTNHRQGLIQMEGFVQKNAAETINRVHAFQSKAYKKLKTRFAFLADEFYIQAILPFPEDNAYESYIQLEDGIGMIRKLTTEIEEFLKKPRAIKDEDKRFVMVTGTAAAPFLSELINKIEAVYPMLKITVMPVINRYFGERITVAGLLTGKDILEQVMASDALKEADAILLPSALFRADEEVLLDDITRELLEQKFGKPVFKVETEGNALMNVLLNGGRNV